MKKSRIAISRSSSDSKRFNESSPSGISRSRANTAPPHDGRLVATATTSKLRSTRLRRLEPLPDTTTPSLIAGLGDHHSLTGLVRDDLAYHLRAAGHLLRVDDEDHPQPHVEGAE